MKKLFLFILFSFIFFSSYGQQKESTEQVIEKSSVSKHKNIELKQSGGEPKMVATSGRSSEVEGTESKEKQEMEKSSSVNKQAIKNESED